jgi:NAD(P)-dependent dehydrogenase (short-subunit alcohol dehydrogenase family)
MSAAPACLRLGGSHPTNCSLPTIPFLPCCSPVYAAAKAGCVQLTRSLAPRWVGAGWWVVMSGWVGAAWHRCCLARQEVRTAVDSLPEAHHVEGSFPFRRLIKKGIRICALCPQVRSASCCRLFRRPSLL